MLLVGVAVLALAPTHEVAERAHRPATRATSSGTMGIARWRPSQVATAQIARRRVARKPFSGYLGFAYGRASAVSVRAVTSALRRRLEGEHGQVTPVESRRRPRVVTTKGAFATWTSSGSATATFSRTWSSEVDEGRLH